MDPRKNPFVPGAGAPPPEFGGRDDLIEAADIALDRTKAGLYANDIIILGRRGVGKTVLLNHLHRMARAKKIRTVKFEVPDAQGGHLARELAAPLNVILRGLDRKAALGEAVDLAGAALGNFATMFRLKYEGFSIGAEPARPKPDQGALERELPDLLVKVARAAGLGGTALALFIDEIQYLIKPELSALIRACHEAAQEGAPFMLIGTGLPQMTALAGDAKSYAERLFDYPELGPLDAVSARKVLRDPSVRFGVEWADAALDQVIADTQCYPYFLQTWGKFAWDAAEESPITREDVARAQDEITLHLDRSFFRTRFDRCTDREKRYLRAMAELGDGDMKTGDIAGMLGSSSPKLAPVRKRLIDLGMIYAPRYGETAFTVPLFDDFMKRVMPELGG